MHLHRHRGCPTMTTRTSKAKHTNRCMSPTKFTLGAFVACTLLLTASQQFMLIMPPPSNLRIVPKDIDGTVGSQADNNVDKLISHKLFKKDFAGTFVEFGCSNGIRNSNSLLLEREYGWNGLCIEPNPFEAKFAIKNRKHGIHALISYPAQDYKYAAMSGHCAQGSGIVEFMNEKSKNNLKTCPKARGKQLNYVQFLESNWRHFWMKNTCRLLHGSALIAKGVNGHLYRTLISINTMFACFHMKLQQTKQQAQKLNICLLKRDFQNTIGKATM